LHTFLFLSEIKDSILAKNISVKTVQDLEFTTVLSHVSEFCISELGKEQILAITPIDDPEKLKDEVNQLRAQESATHRWLKDAKDDGKLNFDDLNRVVEEIDSLVKGQCFWPQLLKIEEVPNDTQKVALAKNTVELILSRYEVKL
jgi:dsDNA-specific endonuclease/ATPase MutS2